MKYFFTDPEFFLLPSKRRLSLAFSISITNGQTGVTALHTKEINYSSSNYFLIFSYANNWVYIKWVFIKDLFTYTGKQTGPDYMLHNLQHVKGETVAYSQHQEWENSDDTVSQKINVVFEDRW